MTRDRLQLSTHARLFVGLVLLVLVLVVPLWQGWRQVRGAALGPEKRQSPPAHTAPPGAGADAAARTSQIARGGAIYLTSCKRCHDSMERTEPFLNVISPPLNARSLAWHGSGRTLWEYVSRYMPFDRPGTLTDEESYAVLAFLLDINGLLPSRVAVGPDTMERLQFDPFHPSVTLTSAEHEKGARVPGR